VPLANCVIGRNSARDASTPPVRVTEPNIETSTVIERRLTQKKSNPGGFHVDESTPRVRRQCEIALSAEAALREREALLAEAVAENAGLFDLQEVRYEVESRSAPSRSRNWLMHRRGRGCCGAE
jgi:hypothetical protein